MEFINCRKEQYEDRISDTEHKIVNQDEVCRAIKKKIRGKAYPATNR